MFTPQPDVFRVSFTTSNEPFRLRKIHKVAQIVAKVLLTSKGSDFYRPDVGTGIKSLVGKLVSRTNLPHLRRDIALWITEVEKTLLDSQEEFSYPLEERIQRLELQEANFDFQSLGWIIRVRILTEAGQNISVDIGPQLGAPAEEGLDPNIRDVLSIDTGPV